MTSRQLPARPPTWNMRRRAAPAALLLAAALALGGCGTEEHVNVFHATWSEGAASRDFSTDVPFLAVGVHPSYAITYKLDRAQQVPTHDQVTLYLPTTVKAGDVYTEADATLVLPLLLYQDAQGNWLDARENGSTVRITVTTWAGPGGYGRGTFSAVLNHVQPAYTVTMTGGTWEGFISN